MPANVSTRQKIERAKTRIAAGKAQIEEIQRSAEEATPDLERTVAEVHITIDSLLEAIDEVVPDQGNWGAGMRFVRRMLSREMIITVVAIIAIWAGGLEAQEAIAVAIAGGGLALGRGVAKQRSGGTDA